MQVIFVFGFVVCTKIKSSINSQPEWKVIICKLHKKKEEFWSEVLSENNFFQKKLSIAVSVESNWWTLKAAKSSCIKVVEYKSVLLIQQHTKKK